MREHRDKSESHSPIQKFYSGSRIFITGATGFLGKLLIEKLLRACPDVSALYILIREKRGKDTKTRTDELMDDVVFEILREKNPKFREKMVGISGDCSMPDLGLNMQDKQLLFDEVEIVFHVAATIRFDEKLKLAVDINVRGAEGVVKLCKRMKKIKSIVHVSTAYSNCNKFHVEERFHPSPMNYKDLIRLTEAAKEDQLEKMTSIIIEDWPNTYNYTKAVGENVIYQDATDLPIGVFRPAVVVATYKEPLQGWVGNIYGIAGASAAVGCGLLHVFRCNTKCYANFVPADMCVNAMIAMAKEIGDNFKICQETQKDYEIPVYNYVSNNDRPITWEEVETFGKVALNYPTMNAIWYYFAFMSTSFILTEILKFVFHTIPAFILDNITGLFGKSLGLRQIYKKLDKNMSVVTYFMLRDWKFETGRIQSLWKNMSTDDQRLFFYDLKQLDWQEYFQNYFKGIRVYLLRDPISTIEEAKKKWNRLYWMHQFLKLLFGFLFLRIVWWILSYFL